MRTTPQGVALKGLTHEQMHQQLANKLSACCHHALLHLLSTPDPHVTHWLINSGCAHSKLCYATADCETCGRYFTRCVHCGPQLCKECLARLEAAGPTMAAAVARLTDRVPPATGSIPQPTPQEQPGWETMRFDLPAGQ